ncbi:GPR1/FUN34/yaaH family-domain-containing protein [Mycena alexandri]|uniref:GPR1/FUN34/yaaH family-domain-containing protein n=1 Tax=Mycena alexandri TaxID=1745969 RepID=A0AAD6XB41_9AGAR|nr:GPR1/FUN34/yaaH family-domain-containing protein [Mycena alexandri]
MTDVEANGTGTGRRGILTGNRDAAGRGSFIGNPTGLGMLAFATTLFVLSLYTVNTRHVAEPNAVLGLSLFTGGLATFMAGMWHFPRGNGYGAAVFTMYGTFWMSYGLFFIPSTGIMGSYTEGQFRSAVGIYFMAWMMVTVILGIASIRRHITWILFFGFLTFTFLLLGVSNFSTKSGLPKAAGAFGIITSLIAYYHALSKLLEGDYAPFGLPLGRIGGPSQRY